MLVHRIYNILKQHGKYYIFYNDIPETTTITVHKELVNPSQSKCLGTYKSHGKALTALSKDSKTLNSYTIFQ